MQQPDGSWRERALRRLRSSACCVQVGTIVLEMWVDGELVSALTLSLGPDVEAEIDRRYKDVPSSPFAQARKAGWQRGPWDQGEWL